MTRRKMPEETIWLKHSILDREYKKIMKIIQAITFLIPVLLRFNDALSFLGAMGSAAMGLVTVGGTHHAGPPHTLNSIKIRRDQGWTQHLSMMQLSNLRIKFLNKCKF